MRFGLLVLVLVTAGASLHEVAAAQSAPVEDQDARTLYTLGENAFEQGRFRAALDYFQQAYDLSHRPELLYNIGQAADRLREDRRALEAFEQYVRERPNASNRAVVEARIVILRQTVETSARTTTATPAEAAETTSAVPTSTETARETAPSEAARSPERSSSEGGANVGAILALGGGGAAAAVGAVLFALGMHDVSSVENAGGGSSWSSVSDAYDRSKTRTMVGAILMGVGVAGAATGVVLLATSSSHSDAAVARVEVRALPTGLSIRGSF